MKKLISLLSILFLITLFVPFKQAKADRGSGGFRGDGGHEGGFRGEGGRGGSREDGGRGGFHGHGGFLPGLIIGGVLGWGLAPNYYPPDYSYSPPPEDYYPPPVEGNQVPPSATQGSGGQIFIYPRQGQSEEQKAEDVDNCHDWAVGQTGFDPSIPPVGAPDARTIQKSKDYLRAISACLDARGYTLRVQ